MLSIVRIDKAGKHLDNAINLFKEYFIELNENLCFQNFDEELKDPLKKYGPPGGSLFIAYYDEQPVACIGFQTLDVDGVCKMKRLYVQPAFRKNKIAAQLVKLLLKDAKQKGFTKMVLDTLEKLQPAIKLYESFGFEHTGAYYNNPLPGVVYMQRLV